MRSPAAIRTQDRNGILDGWADWPLSPPAAALVAAESIVDSLV